MACSGRESTLLTVVSIALALASSARAVPFFAALGDLPGGIVSSAAADISSDGSTVVGFSSSATGATAFPQFGDSEGFRWTSDGGMSGLGDLAGGGFRSAAYAISADGSTIVGEGETASGREAFRWTAGSGMVGLGELAGGGFSSIARDVSADGSVVVGSSTSSLGSEAFRWTEEGGIIGLGDLPGGSSISFAFGVSADGSVVAGSGVGAEGGEAFRWTQADGMMGLGDLPGGIFSSSARAISADGSVVVGRSRAAEGDEPFRWTAATGMVSLGIPGLASAISADGSAIVGDTAGGAFVWHPALGVRSIQVLLETQGVDLTGWTLDAAWSVIAEGETFTIVGSGINPSGDREAWLAIVPEPQTALLVAIGLFSFGVRRRSR